MRLGPGAHWKCMNPECGAEIFVVLDRQNRRLCQSALLLRQRYERALSAADSDHD